ncbi:hypothetical protein BV378_02155 [Nostoc sp. RF31YmG]|jgi:apolipoprotein D and lipocalin family protein|nr:hypothetical protein BV378_02155 [Nostoc sp. RF31YmG]
MSHPDVVAIPALDLQRYLGTWYEIARLPMRHEPANGTDVSAHYSLDEDGKVRVQNRCRVDGEVEESIGQATPVDDSNAKLEVSFLPEGLRWIPFTKGDYWVLKLDADYQVALVGTPDRHFLWLLARQPQLDAATRLLYLDEARRQGFDLSKLIDTPHTGTPTA